MSPPIHPADTAAPTAVSTPAQEAPLGNLILPALRSYQRDQVAAVEALHFAAEPVRATLIESATGTGKTTMAADLVSRAVARGETVLFLAHRVELIDQAAARFRSFGLQVSIERGSLRAGPEPVVCASVQTMRGERLEAFPRDAFDLIVYDECHHSVAPGGMAIVAWFHTARVVGLTATPDRADGIPLGRLYGAVAHRFGIAEAIAGEYLVPVRGIRVDVPGMDLSKVRTRRQKATDLALPGETVDLLAPAGQARLAKGSARYSVDLHPGDLGRAALAPAAVEGVVVPLLALAGARRTVVFAVDLKHAAAIADGINARQSGGARVVHYKMKPAERKAVLADHREGAYQFLVNVTLLTEGYDDPAIECVAMARPTMSRVLYCQCVGRALRLLEGKVEALLLDFVGVGSRFDLVGPEDALGAALAGPMTYYTPPLDASEAARRAALGLGPVARIRPALSKPGPVEKTVALVVPTRITYTTRVVQLIKRGTQRAHGWLSRLFGGN